MKNLTPPKSQKVTTFWSAMLFALLGLLVALSFSWILLALGNFSYGLWHDVGGIDQAIETYGPQNRNRFDFQLTDKSQRVELFSQIVKAIHLSGQGLSDITYQVPSQPIQTLLHEAEVIHLQDVANLIDVCKWAALVAFIVWLAMGLYFKWAHKPAPSFKLQSLGVLVFVSVITLVVFMWGPTDVFYAMHESIFPDGHQWFFYYQDSLMSTMMWAPNLFGWIAIEWLVVSLLMFAFLQWIWKLLLR